MNAQKLDEVLSSKTKSMSLYAYGQCVDMDSVMSFADKRVGRLRSKHWALSKDGKWAILGHISAFFILSNQIIGRIW